MLTDAQIEEFQSSGFLNAGRMLDDAQLVELTSELERILDKGPAGFSDDEPQPALFRNLAISRSSSKNDKEARLRPVWQIVNMWEASMAFERLIYHPLIVKAISQLTGFDDLQVWHDNVQYKPPEVGGEVHWHQDAPLWPSIEPMTPVSAWVPFDDADVQNGCMWMVPGSHRWGDMAQYLGTNKHLQTLADFARIGEDFTPPAAVGEEIKAVPCPVRRGQVHFHHSLTWHGSPMNTSGRPRRAIAIHYMTSDARYTGRAHPMQRFIEAEVGGPMLQAGPHFPIVCRDGVAIAAP